MELVIDILLVLLLLTVLLNMVYFLITEIKSDIELKKAKKQLEENFKKFEAELEEAIKNKPKKETTKRKVGRPKKGE